MVNRNALGGGCCANRMRKSIGTVDWYAKIAVFLKLHVKSLRGLFELQML